MTTQQTIIAILYSPDGAFKDLYPQLKEDMFTEEQTKEAFSFTKQIVDQGLTPTTTNLFSFSKKKGNSGRRDAMVGAANIQRTGQGIRRRA